MSTLFYVFKNRDVVCIDFYCKIHLTLSYFAYNLSYQTK